MISDKDIQKLTLIFATKVELTQTEQRIMAEIQDFKIIMIKNYDGLISRFDTMIVEYASLKISDDRQNRQIKQLAHHTGVELDP